MDEEEEEKEEGRRWRRRRRRGRRRRRRVGRKIVRIRSKTNQEAIGSMVFKSK